LNFLYFMSRGEGFGDNANTPWETPQWVLDAIAKKRREDEEAEQERKANPCAEIASRCRDDYEQHWARWLDSSMASAIELREFPKPWKGHSPGAWYSWPQIFHFLQVSRRLEHGHIHWTPMKYSVIRNLGSTLPLSFKDSPVPHYSEFLKKMSSPEGNARRTILHTTCPPHCPDCGACGARSTFPGCGREPLPSQDEKTLRSVTDQLLEIRRDIQTAALKRAHSKCRMEDACLAMQTASASNDAEAVCIAKQAFEVCSKAYNAASEKFDAKAAEYKTLYDENWRVGHGTKFWRLRPPR